MLSLASSSSRCTLPYPTWISNFLSFNLLLCGKTCKERLMQLFTMFENHQKCLIRIFEFLHFPPIFVRSKVTCQITLLVNVARFARHTVGDFFVDILNTVLPSYIMFFKDSPKWHFTFKTWKSNQSFFARAQIFRRIARSITIFFAWKID